MKMNLWNILPVLGIAILGANEAGASEPQGEVEHVASPASSFTGPAGQPVSGVDVGKFFTNQWKSFCEVDKAFTDPSVPGAFTVFVQKQSDAARKASMDAHAGAEPIYLGTAPDQPVFGTYGVTVWREGSSGTYQGELLGAKDESTKDPSGNLYTFSRKLTFATVDGDSVTVRCTAYSPKAESDGAMPGTSWVVFLN